MNIEELVTKFTADVSDYRKGIEEIKNELRSVSGVTETVKNTTKKALSSSSAEVQKLGKQLQNLTDKQNKHIQSAIDSGKRIADFKEKSRLLVSQLNAQRSEIEQCREALRKLGTQYREQQNFIGDYDGGMEGIRKQRQEMIDYIHAMEAAGKSAYKTDEIDKYKSALRRLYDDLAIFDNGLKNVGLNPANLKSNTLENLKREMQSLSKQERTYKENSEKTESQIKSTNQSIAIEKNRYNDLKEEIRQNAVSVENLYKKLNSLGKNKASSKLKNSFSGVKSVFGKIGSAASSAFSKVKSGFSKIRTAAGGANKSLLSTVKSIRRIGIASLGLKVCKSVFGELRSIVTDYLSQNEALNSRVESLKSAFGNALAPAINVVVGLFEKLMPYLMAAVNAVSSLFSSLGVSKSISATASAVSNTADATKELSEAQNDLYGFDQITKQSDNSDSSKSDVSSSSPIKAFSGDISGVGEKFADSCNKIISKLNALNWDGIQNRVNNAVSGIAKSLNGFVYNFDWYGAGQLVGNGINTIFGAIDTFLTNFDFKALGTGFADNLNGLFDKVDFKKIGKTISDAISGVFDFISGFLETLDWQQVARDIEDLIKGVDWSRMTSALFRGIGAAIGALSALLGTWIVDAFSAMNDYFADKIKECGGNVGDGILLGLSEVWQNITNWVKVNIFDPFINGFKNAFGIASPSKVMKEQGRYIIDGLFDGIGNIWSKVQSKFTDLKNSITNFFTGQGGLHSKIRNLGNTLVNKFADGMSGLKSKFTSLFRSPLNGVIEMINNMVGRVNGYLNISVNSTMANILKKLGVSISGGHYQLFSIPNIPQLANGGVIDKPTLAMVGERGKEAVVPLENNTGWISKIARMIVEYTNSSGNAGTGDIVIPIQIGDERIMIRSDKRNALKKDKYSKEAIIA